MKVLAVGDIHTKLWVIEEVKKIADEYDAVVFCGDYADDFGASPIRSMDTWRSLYSMQQHNPDKIKLVAGNHDYIYVHNTRTKQTGYNYVTQTLIDAPDNREIREWLEGLPIVLEFDGVAYSHAGMSEAWNGEFDVDSLWTDNSPIWVRPGPTGPAYKPTPQVFGHTPSETCWEVQPNIWCIDTFSTMSDGTPIGDHTALEVLDGKDFKKVKINDDYRTNRKQSRISY